MFRLSSLDRFERICVTVALAFLGSFLLGGTYLPTLSYFWGLGVGRVLLSLAVICLPLSNAGRFRPCLLALSLLGLVVSLFFPSLIFSQWVLITLLYLLLEVTIDSLVLQNATEQEAPLELGILSAGRLLGLWGGFIIQHSDLANTEGAGWVAPGILAFFTLFWLFMRETPNCRFLLSQVRALQSVTKSDLQDAYEQVVRPRPLGALLNLFAVAFLTGHLSGAVLPYPLIYPSHADLWLTLSLASLNLMTVGLLATWFLEKARLRTQLSLSFVCLTALMATQVVGFEGEGGHPVWGLGLCVILLSSRVVLRETFKLDPVLRAALIITLWTAGGLSGDLSRTGLPLPWKYFVQLSAFCTVLIFFASSFRHYNEAAQFVESKLPPGKTERFGDRIQDFQGVDTTASQKRRWKIFRRLSDYLLVHLPVALFLSAVIVLSVGSGLYIFENKSEWEQRVKNAEKTFRAKLFFSGFERRLEEEMIAGQRVPNDWLRFISNNFNSDGKPLTDRDPWGTPYRITVDSKEVQIQSAGPDRIFETADDLENTIPLPAGVK